MTYGIEIAFAPVKSYLVFLAHAHNDGVQRSMMAMANGWKQVMFHLIIETTRHDKAEDTMPLRAISAEVLSRDNLVAPEVGGRGVGSVRCEVIDLGIYHEE